MDFYVTAIVCSTHGEIERAYIVDGDDSKIWHWKVQVQASEQQALMDLGDGRRYVYNWEQKALTEAAAAFDEAFPPLSAERLLSSFGTMPYVGK